MPGSALPSSTLTNVTLAEEATARSLILGLIHRYASLAREDTDHKQMTELFEPGGVVQFPDGRELPPSRLGEIRGANPPKLLRHHITTIDIQFTSPDEAHCQTYVIAGTHLKLPDHWGRWDDVVKKQSSGRWLFKKKVVIVDGMDSNGWLTGVLGPAAGAESETC